MTPEDINAFCKENDVGVAIEFFGGWEDDKTVVLINIKMTALDGIFWIMTVPISELNNPNVFKGMLSYIEEIREER